MQQSNRRKHARLVDSIDLELGGAGFQFNSRTINISTHGLLCRMEREIPVMTRIDVVLDLPVAPKKRKKIRAKAVVVRCQYQPPTGYFEVALFFSEITETSRDVLKKYIDARSKKVTP